MPLYLSKDTLAAADQATAEAQTSGLSDDVRQTMEQATKPPEPVASPWTIPSLESLGLPSLPSLPAATSPVMSAIGAVPQIGQRTVQMGQDAGQVAVRWALPSLEGLGVVPPKPQQPASDGSEPPTPSSSAPAPDPPAAPAPGVPAGGSGAASPPKGEIDNSSRASFARTAYPYALDAAGGDPELAKRLIASAISENGTVGSGKPIGVGFNFGGIKQDPVYGVGSGTYGTWESEGGQRVNQNDSFAHYPDAATGFKAIPAFLQRNFPKQWAQYQQDHDAAALYRNINAAGYATDQNWHQAIEGIAARDVEPNVRGTQTPTAARPSPTTPPPAEQTPAAQAQAGRGGLDVNGITEAYKGVPYTFGGPGGRTAGYGAPTDCSGFVSEIYKDKYGLPLVAHTDGAYNQLRQMGAPEVDQKDARPGDVVFYLGAGDGGAISHHMGIYAGDGRVLDMSVAGSGGVQVRDVNHAGHFVILRDPRLNPQTPQSASVPPQIQPSGVAEASGGERVSNRELQAQAQTAPDDQTMYRAPLGDPNAAGSSPPAAQASAGGPAAPADAAPTMYRMGLTQPSQEPVPGTGDSVDRTVGMPDEGGYRNPALDVPYDYGAGQPGAPDQRIDPFLQQPSPAPPWDRNGANDPDAMYRQPLGQPSVQGPPVRDDYATNPGDQQSATPAFLPGDGGTAPMPPGQRPYDPDQGPHELPPPDLTPTAAPASVWTPGQPLPADLGLAPTQGPPAPTPASPLDLGNAAQQAQRSLKPVWDAAGNTVGYVQESAGQGILGEGGRSQEEKDRANAYAREQAGITNAPDNSDIYPLLGSMAPPLGGTPQIIDEMAPIQQRAAAFVAQRGRPDRTGGLQAVDDPEWRRANPEDAARYDDLRRNYELNVMGQTLPGGPEPARPTSADANAGASLIDRVGAHLAENRAGVAALDAERASRPGVATYGTLGFSPAEQEMRGLTRTPVVPPDVAVGLGVPRRIPDDPRLAQAVEAAGGTITDRGVELNLTRAQGEGAAGRPASRGGVFYEAVPEGGRSNYAQAADNPLGVGGSQVIPPAPTVIRSPLVLDAAPGERTGFNQAMTTLSGVSRDDLIAANVAQTTTYQRLAELDAQMTAAEKAGHVPPELKAAYERAGAEHDAATARMQEIAGRAVDASQVDRAIAQARSAGPEGSPERAAALKDLVAKYGGDPDLIDHLLEIRGADASESAWAIKENIVAQNARKAGHDAVVALTDNLSPSEYQAALEKAVQAHPDWKAQKAIYDDLDARLSQAPGQSQERANLWDQRDAAQRKLDNIHDRLIDTVRVEAPAKIQEVMDVREAANPTPGAPHPAEEANQRLEALQRQAFETQGRLGYDHPQTQEMWRQVDEAYADYERHGGTILDSYKPGEPGYALRPEYTPPEGVPASTIAPNPARAQAEEAYSRLQDQVQAVRESLGSTPTPRQLNTLMDLEDALKEARHRWLDVQTEPHFVTTPRGGSMSLNGTFGFAPAESGAVTNATRAAENMPSPLARSPRDIGSASEMIDTLRQTDFVPPSKVVDMIGERPEYLGNVAQYMAEQRQKVVNGQLTPRDVAKAYFMTVASQGSDAIRVSTLESKVPGFKIPEQFWSAERAADGSPLVRPEEAAAAWLFTPRGQEALNDIERGAFNREAWAEGAAVRRAFGDDRFRTTNVFGERAPVNGRTQFNMESITPFTEQFNQVAQEAARTGDFAALDRFTKRLNGVQEAKLGFIKHALGFGETPTIDAVEINTWLTGKGDIGRLQTKEADLVRTTNSWLRDPRVGAYLRERILGEFQQIHGMLPPETTADLPPEVFNHVLHHWIWDKMKGTATTHEGFYNAMRTAATTGLAPAAGTSAPANLARYANSALNTGGLGALVGSQADTEDATDINLPTGGTMRFSPTGARIGALAGMGLGLAGARLARGEGGALATFGINPRAKTAEEIAQNVERVAEEKAKAGYKPPNPLEIAQNVRYSVGMLGNPTATGLINAASGPAEIGSGMATFAVRTGLLEGRPAPVVYGLAELAKGLAEGVVNAAGAAAGIIPKAVRESSDFRPPLYERMDTPVGKAMGWLIDTPGRLATQVPDALFQRGFWRLGRVREASAMLDEAGDISRLRPDEQVAEIHRLLHDPTPEEAQRIEAGAHQFAQELGYRSKPDIVQQKLGGIFRHGDRPATSEDPWVAQAHDFIGSHIMPFFGSIYQINKRGLSLVPGVGSIVEHGLPVKEQIARQVVGAGLIYYANDYAAQGFITGPGPSDPDKLALLRASGWEPSSTYIPRLGWVPNLAFGSAAPILNAVGAYHDSQRYATAAETADQQKMTERVIKDQARAWAQFPVVQGLSSLYTMTQQPVKGATDFLANAASSYVPAALKAEETSKDPYSRTTDREGPFGEQLKQKLIARSGIIPGLGTRQDLPAAQDRFGRPVENPRQGIAAILPRIGQQKEDPAARLFSENGVDVGTPPKEVRVPTGPKGATTPIALTPSEQREWNTIRGQALLEMIDGVSADPDWQQTTPEVRQKFLQRQIAQANDYARQQMLDRIGEAEVKKRLATPALAEAS